MLSPEGRVVMISGANRGIGLATAKVLAERGCTLSLGARRPDSIPLDQIPGDPMVARWEATEAVTSTEWAQATLDRFGRIDAVVMNAGVELGGALEGGDEEAFDKMWEVNFKGPLRLVRATLPVLRRSGHGRVANVVSLAGKRMMRHEILGYSASKHAAIALTHAIRQSGWEDGVRATSICPGLVETDMTSHVQAPAGQFKIDADTIAESVAYAISLPNEATVAEILVNSRFEHLF
jgi:NADP-dependent 3-hydroxy acid dehydrogenase YdfG